LKKIFTNNFKKQATDYNTYPNLNKSPVLVNNLFLDPDNDDTKEGIIELWDDPKNKKHKYRRYDEPKRNNAKSRE
jgi:hypothetical protein